VLTRSVAKRGLTGNEKQVLYGLVRHPTLNDRELSELLGVKVSTVTAIRRRLRRADYFVTRRLPMMHRLGWEILAGGHARLDAPQDTQALAKVREALRESLPNIFHVTASADHLAFLAMAPDYTQFRRDLDELRRVLEKVSLLGDGDVRTAVLPATLTILPTFFDYSHALALAFGLEDHTPFRPEFARQGDVRLTRKESEVLKGLVRFPETNDRALAHKVKVSRQAVSKMRREFEAEDVLRTIRIPNLKALGFELYVTAFARFSPTAVVRTRAPAIEKFLRQTPTFFLAASDAETIVLGAARSYEQFSTLRSSLTRYHEERGNFADDPTVYLALTNSMEILRHCEFAPLVGALK